MKTYTTILCILFLSVASHRFLVAQETAAPETFEDFFMQLLKEIETEEHREAEKEEAPAVPKITPEKKEEQKVPEELKEKDIITNFLVDFEVKEKKDEKKVAVKLPEFKKEALKFFVESLEKLLKKIAQNISVLDERAKRKFNLTLLDEVQATLANILSKKVYHYALYDKAFKLIRKQLVDMVGTPEHPGYLNFLVDQTRPLEKALILPKKPIRQQKKENGKDPFALLGVAPTATAHEILGVKQDATLNEIKKAAQTLQQQWDSTLHPEKKDVAQRVLFIIREARDDALLGHLEEIARPMSLRRKAGLKKLRRFFAQELLQLKDDLAKVVAFAAKPIEQKVKERQTLEKKAEERLKRLAQQKSFYGSYPYYEPETMPWEGKPYHPKRKREWAAPRAPTYGYPEVGRGEPGFQTEWDEDEDRWQPYDKERAAKPEGDKNDKRDKYAPPVTKKPPLLKEKQLKEQIIKHVEDAGKHVDELKKDTEKATSYMKKFERLTNKLADVQLGLTEKRKEKKEWKDIENKYQSAVNQFEKLQQEFKPTKPKEAAPDLQRRIVELKRQLAQSRIKEIETMPRSWTKEITEEYDRLQQMVGGAVARPAQPVQLGR